MMNFVQNEEEIALVISHELAHNVMNHIDAKKTNAGLGMAIGLLLDIGAAVAGVNTQGGFTDAGGKLGGQAFSVDFENERKWIVDETMFWILRTYIRLRHRSFAEKVVHDV